MINRAQFAVFLFVGWSLAAQHAGAASLVEQQLASVQELRITVLVPRYEPIPGISPDELEALLKTRVGSIVERYGLESVDASQQDLVLSIEAAGHVPDAGIIALLVLIELREPAVLIRQWGQGAEQELAVTSWRESLLVLSSREGVIEKLFESMELGATSFAEEAQKARRRRGPDASDPSSTVPDRK